MRKVEDLGSQCTRLSCSYIAANWNWGPAACIESGRTLTQNKAQ